MIAAVILALYLLASYIATWILELIERPKYYKWDGDGLRFTDERRPRGGAAEAGLGCEVHEVHRTVIWRH